MRYGNPAYSGEEYEDFAKYFRASVAPILLPPAMNVLAAYAKGQFVSRRVLFLALQFLVSAAELSPSYKLMKPDAHALFQHGIFPILCAKDEDLQLMNTDPQEYIRQESSLDNVCFFLSACFSLR